MESLQLLGSIGAFVAVTEDWGQYVERAEEGLIHHYDVRPHIETTKQLNHTCQASQEVIQANGRCTEEALLPYDSDRHAAVSGLD